MEHSIDEGLLLTFLRQDSSHHRAADTTTAPDPTSETAELLDSNFRAEVEHFSQDAANAIHDLEVWMQVYDSQTNLDDDGGNNNNAMMNQDASLPLPTSLEDADCDGSSEISDESDSEIVGSLSEELQLLDAMFSADPTSFVSPYLRDYQQQQHPSQLQMQDVVACVAANKQKPPLEEDDYAAAAAPKEAAPPPARRSFHMDESLFDELHLQTFQVAAAASKEDGTTTTTAVQFTGTVGVSCRSIRTQQPLPRPQIMTESQVKRLKRISLGRQLLKRLFRWHNKKKPAVVNDGASSSSSGVTWIPFVMPFCLTEGGGKMCRTPRLISYFEVHIFNVKPKEQQQQQQQATEPTATKPAASQNSDHSTSTTTTTTTGTTSNDEPRHAGCVAIGMSAEGFAVGSNMPGWDANSFGYHGDDGSIFYSASQDIHHQGPRFGAGDVVGCGIDYRTAQVFTTLNGKFLGYSVTLTQQQLATVDWFPTIGLDSHACVQCNFGTDGRPFVYDLQSMIEIGKQVL